jgi:hypothetical protein
MSIVGGSAADIEARFALHLSIVVSQIAGVPVDYVQVLPSELRSPAYPAAAGPNRANARGA